MYHHYHPQICPQTHTIYHGQLYDYVLKQIQALAKSLQRRKVDAPIVRYADITSLNEEILHEVIERIEIGHMGPTTPVGSIVKIVWKL